MPKVNGILKVNSIFESISGEVGGFPQGTWCTFIRLQGCNLNCAWCDSKHTHSNNGVLYQNMSVTAIVSELKKQKLNNKHILITGGEPLCQPVVLELIDELLKQGHKVQVETNGSLIIPPIPQVHWVMDYKCPSSGMSEKMPPVFTLSYNLKSLQKYQQAQGTGSIHIKYVVADNTDLDFALQTIEMFRENGVDILYAISPLDGMGSSIPEIVGIIKKWNTSLLDHIIFSVQLHKLCKLP